MRTFAVLLAAVLLTAPAALADAPANVWVKAAEGRTGSRVGCVLIDGPGGKLLLLGGSASGAPYAQAFDPAAATWAEQSKATPPAARGINPYYQSAFDPKTATVYCFDAGAMFTLDLKADAWKAHGTPEALAGLSWHAVAIDPDGRKLVVVGSDKRLDNLGWTRTAILDLDAGQWSALPPPDAKIVAAHKALVAASESLIDLVGRIRLAWYRDPAGEGTEAERTELAARCNAVRALPALKAFEADLAAVGTQLAAKQLLDALTAARAAQVALGDAMDAQYPVPCSRRNAPVVFDAKNKAFVLFGGDHEDYTLNDTWVLDLARNAWRRAAPKLAPAPLAGHALAYLPGLGRVALFGGYIPSSNPDYRCGPWFNPNPRQLWLYDVAADRWLLAAAWELKRGSSDVPAFAGDFYGYSAQCYTPPPMAAAGPDTLVLVCPGSNNAKSSTWMIRVDASQPDAANAEKLGAAPDQKRRRTGRFVAAYCQVPDAPKPTNLDQLPANQFVRLPDAPRNPAYGCRQRDWGTAVWDSENEQFLLWGGGHCVRSASVPLHYSPLSGRIVEGYDADEPYGYNGGGGFGSSVMNRPWIPVHAYNTYAYDPVAKLLVTGTGFLYDPRRMDWVRMEPMKRPFQFEWGNTVLETTAHGVVAWARKGGDEFGLWLYDGRGGWEDLKPTGRLYRPYCDSEGMAYDGKRDRLLLGWGGGYNAKGDGSITEFSFKTHALTKLTPEPAALGVVANTREMVYVEAADWLLIAEPLTVGGGKEAKSCLRVYDCAKNRYGLLDAGPHPGGGYSQGWQYDAKRKLVFVLSIDGQAWALRLDPATAQLLEDVPK